MGAMPVADKTAVSVHGLNGSALKKMWRVWSVLLFTALFGMSFGVCSLLVSEKMELIVPSAAILVVSVLRLKSFTPNEDDAKQRCPFMVVAGIVCTVIAAAIELIGILLYTGMWNVEVLNQAVLLLLPLLCPSLVIAVGLWINCTVKLMSGENLAPQGCEGLPGAFAAACLLWLLGMIYQCFAISPINTTHAFHYPVCAVMGCAAIWYVNDYLIKCVSCSQSRVNGNNDKDCNASNGDGAFLIRSEKKASLLRSLEKTKLSDRELLVLLLTLEGKTGKEIAQDIKVSIPTIGSYRSRGYEKLGVANKKELLRLVEEIEKGDDGDIHEEKSIEDCEAIAECLSCGGHDQKIDNVGSVASFAMMVAIASMVVMLLFDPFNELLQVKYDTMVLVEYGPSIRAILGTLLLASGFSLIIVRDDSVCADDLSRCEMFQSSFGRHIICLGVVCSSALLFTSSYPNAIGRFCGAIGLMSSCIVIGTHMVRTERKGRGKFLVAILMGCKAISTMCPELVVLAGASAIVIDGVMAYGFSIWMSWPLLSGVGELMFPLCMASALALVAMALINLMRDEPCVSFSPSERNRVESYLIGRGLADLQVEVLLLSLRGLNTPAICSKLHIAPGTVGSYRSRAYSILGVKNLKEAGDLIKHETGSCS